MGGVGKIARSVSQALLDIIANGADPQEYEYFWAIEEGHNRVKLLKMTLHKTKANKKHECQRGCIIDKGQQYFRSSDIQSPTKICATCMAMILYYQDVGSLPPYQYGVWNPYRNSPHTADNSQYEIMMKKILNISPNKA